jgi:hypothetical protein
MPVLTNPAALVYGIDRRILCHEAEKRAEWRKHLFMPEIEEVA